MKTVFVIEFDVELPDSDETGESKIWGACFYTTRAEAEQQLAADEAEYIGHMFWITEIKQEVMP